MVSPQPGKAEFTATDTSPVAWSAAVIPGELSTITLSPKIQTRYGLELPRNARRTRGDPTAPPRTGVTVTWAVRAGGGPTVPAMMITAVTATPSAANPTVGM